MRPLSPVLLTLPLLASGCATAHFAASMGQLRASSIIAWRVVDALWYREQQGKPGGFGVTRIRATVSPNPDQEVRVGVLEEYVGATGTEWRTSVWVASFLAAQLVGRDLASHRFNISVGGFIDGPSAGALIAVAFLAALTGAPIRRDASLTGALAPDGSLAPVDGIPEKVHAAKQAGKTLVGIPAGQAVVAGPDGKEIDVLALGRALGVEVRELSDLSAAYTLLTGRRLPGPRAVSPLDMAVSPGVAKLLRARIQALLDRADTAGRAATQPGAPGVGPAVALARQARSEALVYVARGDVAAAYLRAARAAALAEAAQLVSRGDVPAAQKRVASALEGLERELAGVAEAPGRRAMALLAGHNAAARARGFLAVAQFLSTPAGAPAATRLAPPVLGSAAVAGGAYLRGLYLTLASHAVELARDVLAAGGRHAAFRFDPAGLQREARSFVSAAVANVEYIDALLLEQLAEQHKRPVEVVRMALAQHEVSYLLAMRLARMAAERRLGEAPSVHARLAALAEAVSSYVESAVVVTKYYSLAALVPETGPAATVRRERALLALLARAEIGARKAAARARARLRAIPLDARLYYRAAASLVGGAVREKLRALALFWRSAVASNVAATALRR